MSHTRSEKAVHAIKEIFSVGSYAGAMAFLTNAAADLRDQTSFSGIKEFTGKIVSGTGAVLDGATGIEYFTNLIGHWNYLSNKDRAMIITAGIVGLGGTIYNAMEFGSVERLICNGTASGLAATNFKLGSSLTTFAASNAKRQAAIDAAAGIRAVEAVKADQAQNAPILTGMQEPLLGSEAAPHRITIR